MLEIIDECDKKSEDNSDDNSTTTFCATFKYLMASTSYSQNIAHDLVTLLDNPTENIEIENGIQQVHNKLPNDTRNLHQYFPKLTAKHSRSIESTILALI